MLKLIRAYYALKAIMSLHKQLRKTGWKQVKGHFQFTGYNSYMKNIGIRFFLVKVPKDVFSDTVKKDLEECLKEFYECMTYNAVREGLISEFVQHSESTGFFDRMFEKFLKTHPFNVDDYNKKKE